MKSQNNRAFRSNPNWLFKDKGGNGKRKLCHKITEPSAQIPTRKRMDINGDGKIACHKITEPSAQIPTNK